MTEERDILAKALGLAIAFLGAGGTLSNKGVKLPRSAADFDKGDPDALTLDKVKETANSFVEIITSEPNK